MRRCKDSPGVKPDCTLRLASTPIPILRGPIPKPDRLLRTVTPREFTLPIRLAMLAASYELEATDPDAEVYD